MPPPARRRAPSSPFATTVLVLLSCLVVRVSAATDALRMEPRAESAAGGVGAGNGDGDGGFKDAFLSSVSMILVSEMGDETFIIAAIMAMRHPRVVVFSGAIAALSIMTVLGVALGLVVPNLISKDTVSKAAFVLYTFFGCRLLYIAWKADPAATMQEEVSEVEEKLGGGLGPKPPAGPLRRALNRVCTPIFLEAFILTFLAEWGDRSQITTIALAAHKEPYGVVVGGIIGHAFCTGLAVLGGRVIALKISQRVVAIAGGLLFFVFAFHALFYGAPGSDITR
jgi:Ca2+/H+ antiporter, TMEM165/GDT1 family